MTVMTQTSKINCTATDTVSTLSEGAVLFLIQVHMPKSADETQHWWKRKQHPPST